MKIKTKMFHRSKANIILAFYITALSVLILFFVQQFLLPDVIPTITKKAPETVDYFKDIPLQAKAVYIIDTSTNKKLFGKNEQLPLPLASITKIMTGICALDTLGKDYILDIQESDISKEEKIRLSIDEKWTVEDLLSFTLIESSNAGATALGREVSKVTPILSCMNQKALDLNLFETKFFNDTGLDIASSSGAYGSAENISVLLETALQKYGDIFEKTQYRSYNISAESGTIYRAVNTNRVSNSIVGIMSSKTGLTDTAGGNLVFAMNAGLNHTVIIAILGSTEDGRFSDALELSGAVIKTLGSE